MIYPPNKLLIAGKIVNHAVCEKSDGFYLFNGDADNSTVKLTNEQMAQVDAEYVAQEAQYKLDDCKQKASALLYETDWTTIPDVADPANSPYLTNQAEFIAWRNQVRALAVNPIADPVFPTKPNEVWG